MQDDTKKIIEERFKSLPEKIQVAITESNWDDQIRLISQNNNLRVDQSSALETETFLTMLGLTNPNEYKENIQKELEIGGGLADTITKEVNDRIFREIKSFIVEVDERDKREEENLKKSDNSVDSSKTLIGDHLGINREEVVKEMKNDIEIVDDDEGVDDIVSEKLGGVMKTEKEDHSLNLDKPLPEKNQNPGKIENSLDSDPYREAIE
jgi:hypothetical protein